MKLYLSLTKKEDNQTLIILRLSTANTEFKEGKTIRHLATDENNLTFLLIKLLKETEKKLNISSYIKDIKADIKFKGDSDFNYLISDIFWFHLKEPSFLFKKKILL